MDEIGGNIEQLVARLKDKQILLKPNTYKPRRAGKRYKGRSKLPAGEAQARLRKRNRELRRRCKHNLKESFYYLMKTYRWRNRKRVEAGRKPVEFKLSFEEYKRLWQEAGMVQDGNTRIWAFRLRGNGEGKARLRRIDDEKPFTLENCVVLWRGVVLANGRKISKEEAQGTDSRGKAG